MLALLLTLGALIFGAQSMVVSGNRRREIKRKGLPMKDRPPSGRAFWNSWDLKSNRAGPTNRANLLFWRDEKYISPNADNMLNQHGGREFLSNYRAMLDKDFHRTPKELNPDQFQRYPMSSLHGLRSLPEGQFGIAESRQNVLGDGIGFSHMRTGGRWNPHSQGTTMPSSYNLDTDLSTMADHWDGSRPDDYGSKLFAKRGLF